MLLFGCEVYMVGTKVNPREIADKSYSHSSQQYKHLRSVWQKDRTEGQNQEGSLVIQLKKRQGA